MTVSAANSVAPVGPDLVIPELPDDTDMELEVDDL